MALTPGMRDRFEALTTEDDSHLVKVEMSDRKPLFGYLRLVEGNFFVLEEVVRGEAGGSTIQKTRESNLSIMLVTGFAKTQANDPEIPDNYLRFGTI